MESALGAYDKLFSNKDIDDIGFRVAYNDKIRSRLQRLMDSDVARVLSRQYMRTLSERVDADRLDALRRRVDRRKVDESRRMKRLTKAMQIQKLNDHNYQTTEYNDPDSHSRTNKSRSRRVQHRRAINLKMPAAVPCMELNEAIKQQLPVYQMSFYEHMQNSICDGSTEGSYLNEGVRQNATNSAQIPCNADCTEPAAIQLLRQQKTCLIMYGMAQELLGNEA